MDPVLMKSIGVEFAHRFASTNVDNIMTNQLIEKAFQNGRKSQEESGIRAESLAIINRLENNQTSFQK